MQEDIKVKLHEAYDKLIEYPLKVQEIFNDFYGEARVDLQGIPSYDDFEETLRGTRVDYLIDRHWDRVLSNATTDKAISLIESLRNSESRSPYFTDTLSIATYVLPACIDILRNVLGYKPFILVYFPFVKVTNENNRFVDIQDLYAKVPITMDGRSIGSLSFNRSTYPISHLRSDYMHSHCPGTNLGNLREFKPVCLGTGPIRATIASLCREFTNYLWQLFCLELDRVTKVESLRGIPYRRLEEIEKHNVIRPIALEFGGCACGPGYISNIIKKEDFVGFIKWLIRSKVLKFNLCPTGFAIAHTFYDVMLKLSNEFIKYWNVKFEAHTTSYSLDDIISIHVLNSFVVKDGRIYSYTGGGGDRTYSEYEGADMFIFKGREVKFHVISQLDDEPNNEVLLLSAPFAQNVLKVILEILNYNYGREERKEGVTSISEGKFYI